MINMKIEKEKKEGMKNEYRRYIVSIGDEK